MLIDVIKEFSCLDSIWEEYIQFLEIKSFTEASHYLRDMYMNIISILTYIDLECTDEKNSLFSDVDIVPEIVGIIEKDIKYLENMQMVQDKNDMIDEMFPWDELSDDDFPVAVTEILFDDRCHYHELWKGEDLQEETVLSFLDKQRDYLRIMNLSSFNELYFVKSDQEIIEALGKLRWVDNFADIVYEVLNKDKEFSDMSIIGIRKALWKIFDVAKEHKIMWQGRTFTEDSFMQEDLLTICRWIMEI